VTRRGSVVDAAEGTPPAARAPRDWLPRAGRIRVLSVISRLNIGGPAQHATLLTERLAASRYESLLVTGLEDPDEGNYLAFRERASDRLLVMPALRRSLRPGRDLVALGRLVAVMRQWRPHLVHTHTAKAGAVGRVAARLARVPVVVHTYHGHVFRGYFSPPTTRVFLAIERRLARHTDRLVAVSPAVRDELLHLGIGTPGTLVAVPLGLDLQPFVDCERLRGSLRTELALAPDTPLVGIVARLVPIKAHEVFLAAMARVLREVATTRFLVVGDGELRPSLERQAAALGLAGHLRFLGWRRDLDRLYADLDVAVLCSRNEGAPVSLIEAMAAGCPVVATRVGGVPDLVEDGVVGRLVPPDDPGALADAVVSVLCAPPARRRAMGAAGRSRAVPAFAAERLVADIDGLYTELLHAKQGLVR